ncbi:hypothetical protein HKBW3S43_02084, partial [Candidatus Hakubella thermalkaliphila]
QEGFAYDGATFSPPSPPSPTEVIERANALIRAALAAADLAIIRALVAGDTVRIAAHNLAQAARRAQLKRARNCTGVSGFTRASLPR